MLTPDDRETLRLQAKMLLNAVSSGASDARFFKISAAISKVLSESVEQSGKEGNSHPDDDVAILLKVAAEEDINVLYFE